MIPAGPGSNRALGGIHLTGLGVSCEAWITLVLVYTYPRSSIASVRNEAYPHSFMRRATPGSRPSDTIAWS